MQLLILTPFLPHAQAAHGSAVYLHALLGELCRLASVRLCSFATAEEAAHRDEVAAGLGSVRLVARDRGHRAMNAWRWLRGEGPLAVVKMTSAAMRTALREEVARTRPDVALVELTLMAQYLPDLGTVPTILTDHEAAVAVPTRVLPFGLGRARDLRLWDRHFQAAFARASRLQALNPADAEALEQRTGRSVAVRAPIVPIPARSVDPGSAADLLFLGDYSHHPNAEAAVWLARELLPRVRVLGADAQLLLAGPRVTPAVARLGELPGVTLLGEVADLAALLGRGRALVSPLFSGRGSRIKVLTALAHGLPVVANELALAGVDATEPAVWRGEDADTLARHCAGLLADPALARRAGLAARAWAERSIAATDVADQQMTTVQELLRSAPA